MTRLSQYLDVKQVADQALAAGGGSYTLASYNEAVTWRHRFYRFRKAWQKEMHDTTYDQIILRRVPEGTSTVTIDIARPLGTFVPAGASQPNDALLADALQFAAKIEKGDIV